MTGGERQRIDLEGLSVDLATGEIMSDGDRRQPLAPRPLAVLRFLVAHRNEIVTRDQLLEGVWGHLEAGTDDTVNVAISGLRKVLDDQNRPHGIIQTLSRRGYRYVGPKPGPRGEPVMRVGASDPSASASLRRSRPLLTALAAVVLLAIGLGAFRWLNDTRTPPGGREAAEPLLTEPSIAVLPFVDLSTEGDQDAFAGALVDSIMHMLAQVPDLHVAARTSTRAFQDSDADIKEIAAKLRVRAVLEGSVQRSEDKIRVIAQLIDAETGGHLWSKTYDRSAGDLFEIQDDIAAQVSQALHRTLVPATRGPQNLEIFEQLALGQHELDKDTFEAAVKARGHFERALELEPDHVEAMMGLAQALSSERSLGSHIKDERYAALIERGYELAPENPRVVKAMGDLHFGRGERDQAEQFYKRAVSLNPNYAEGYAYYGRALWRRGAFDDALAQLRIAWELDPLSDRVNAWFADAFWSVGRAEEAMARLRENIERNPAYPRNYGRMATYLNQLGQTGEAMRYIEAQRRLDPDSGMRWFRVCEFYNQLADPDASEACTDALEVAHDMPDRVLYLRQQIASSRGQWRLQRKLIRELHERFPEMELIPVILALSHASVDCRLTLETLERAYPEFFGDPPSPRPIYIMGAEFAVHCLREQGRAAQAEALLAAVSDIIERMRLMRAPHYVSGLEGTVLLALEGRHDEALAAFERAVDGGWRYYWWGLDQYPMFGPIYDRPEFQAALKRLRAGVDEQRQYFYRHRDEPLF